MLRMFVSEGRVNVFLMGSRKRGSSDLGGVTKSETLGAGQECPAYGRFS